MSAHLGNALEFEQRGGCERFGLKGPRAAEWLAARRIGRGHVRGRGGRCLVARLLARVGARAVRCRLGRVRHRRVRRCEHAHRQAAMRVFRKFPF